MLLDIRCKEGKLQVFGEGFLRVEAPFHRIVWQIPCQAVTRIATKRVFPGNTLTIYTEQGQYLVEMITDANAAKLYAFFPHLEVGANSSASQGATYKQPGIFHTRWYQDKNLRTYIVTYAKQKDMQRDVAESGKYGWIPQSTVGTGGRLRRSFLWGFANAKQKFTITYVRTPEWLAMNG